MSAMDKKIEQMREMVARLNAAADAYYNGRGELMTDFEWDALFDKVKALEAEASGETDTGAMSSGSVSPDQLGGLAAAFDDAFQSVEWQPGEPEQK